MHILSIDTSCDETAVAIIDAANRSLKSDIVISHTAAMKKYGGIVPEVASREHLKVLPLAFQEALDEAGLPLQSINWITATHRPGLLGALLVGVSFAKGIAFANKIPFTGMHHMEAHLFSPHLGEAPAYPWIALIVSGGHTELYRVDGDLEFEKLGETLDDAAGEAFDKIGKLMGLEYPAGPLIDKLCQNPKANRKAFTFPCALPNQFDFSFSGLKTSVLQATQKMGTITDGVRIDLLASAQEAILEPLIKRIEKAKEQTGIQTVVITGGVACNSRLREKLPKAYFPLPKHCSDNAAMVAVLSSLYFKAGRLVASPWSLSALAR